MGEDGVAEHVHRGGLCPQRRGVQLVGGPGGRPARRPESGF